MKEKKAPRWHRPINFLKQIFLFYLLRNYACVYHLKDKIDKIRDGFGGGVQGVRTPLNEIQGRCKGGANLRCYIPFQWLFSVLVYFLIINYITFTWNVCII